MWERERGRRRNSKRAVGVLLLGFVIELPGAWLGFLAFSDLIEGLAVDRTPKDSNRFSSWSENSRTSVGQVSITRTSIKNPRFHSPERARRH